MIQTDSSFFFTKSYIQNLQCSNLSSYKLRHTTKLNQSEQSNDSVQYRFHPITKLNHSTQTKGYKSFQQDSPTQIHKFSLPNTQVTPQLQNKIHIRKKPHFKSETNISGYLHHLNHKQSLESLKSFVKKLNQPSPEPQRQISKLSSLKTQIFEKIIANKKSTLGQAKLFSVSQMIHLQKNIQKRRSTFDLFNHSKYTDPEHYEQLLSLRSFFITLHKNLMLLKENKKKWQSIVDKIPGYTNQIQNFLFDQSDFSIRFKSGEEMHKAFVQENLNAEKIRNQNQNGLIEELKSNVFLKKLRYFGESVQIQIDERFKVRMSQKIEEKKQLHDAILDSLQRTKYCHRNEIKMCIPDAVKEPHPSLNKSIQQLKRQSKLHYISPLEMKKSEMYDKEEWVLYELRNQLG